MSADITEGLSQAEIEKIANAAHKLETKIVKSAQKVGAATWDLAQALYQFHEHGYWSVLGYDSLEEFLAQPELGMSRRQFFRLTKLWRDAVVVKQVPTSALKEIEPSKVEAVMGAVTRGDVKWEDALDDAKGLGVRDLKEKYGASKKREEAKSTLPPSEPAADGGGAEEPASAPPSAPPDEPDDSHELDATQEPIRVECPTCGTWVDSDRLPDLEDHAHPADDRLPTPVDLECHEDLGSDPCSKPAVGWAIHEQQLYPVCEDHAP